MEKISVVAAVKNEERNIRDFLESVKWADEIVIVDDQSTDRTVEICREYTSNIFLNNSAGSFHINKNLGIEKAGGEWILSLDADERITPELACEIKKAVLDKSKQGYYINRKNFFLGRWIKGCGWYPDYIVRLFRKGIAKWPLEIHDVPKIKKKASAGYLKDPMIHISYTSIDQFLDKFTRYTTRLARESYEKGISPGKINSLYMFLLKPLCVFLHKYFLQRGYIDGFRGFFISSASAMTIFMTRVKLWEMHQHKK